MLMRFLFSLILGVAIGFVGWVGGSLYPAPPQLLSALHAQSIADRLQADLQNVDLSALRSSMGQDRFNQLTQRATQIAVSAGNALSVEHQTNVDTSESEAAPPTPAAAVVPVTASGFESALLLCPGMTITNAPAANAQRRITAYAPIINVNGVHLAEDPTHNTCFSSGFGMRGSSMHKGIDFYNAAGGPISAAGDGTIIELKYRDDYGNMILIDHGHGVYTRYCHMSAFQRGLAVGSHVKAGDQLGLMGNTASYPLPIHLHYELLLGDYNNPRQSFGLTPHSPFEYHAA